MFQQIFVSAEGKSLDFLRDAMQGFFWRNQKENLKEYIDLFFDNIKNVFEKHDKYYAKSFFGSLFPLIYVEEEVLEKAKKYVEDFKDANKLLVKDMKEGIDDLERALKIIKKYY